MWKILTTAEPDLKEKTIYYHSFTLWNSHSIHQYILGFFHKKKKSIFPLEILITLSKLYYNLDESFVEMPRRKKSAVKKSPSEVHLWSLLVWQKLSKKGNLTPLLPASNKMYVFIESKRSQSSEVPLPQIPLDTPYGAVYSSGWKRFLCGSRECVSLRAWEKL